MKPRRWRIVSLLCAACLAGGAAAPLVGLCGPFTDVAADVFCPFVLEIFYLGITTGTTPTTYDPSSSVTRLQMAAFLSRTVDRSLQRTNGRAALNHFWTNREVTALGMTTLGQIGQRMAASDGSDVWVANTSSGSISRVRAGDGKLLETWTGASGAYGVRVAMGRIFASSAGGQTRLYQIDPSQPAGAVTTVATNIGASSAGIAFDGARLWVASADGSVSIVTPTASLPWTVTTVTIGGNLIGALWDGASAWVTGSLNALRKLDPAGTILQTVTVGTSPSIPVFDGTNIWVPNQNPSVSVVRASTGTVLATLTGNGLIFGSAFQAAFDGERILVTSSSGKLSLWKAADLSEIGSLDVAGTLPIGVCSDGLNFWIAMDGPHSLARF
ncbi:MAG TPA: S-layer homology domain-containing protein [Thermoanaerobaculia bacterium]|nr:S-layer homology domain-containing protein [Thermoanaerobaculia bacterium]